VDGISALIAFTPQNQDPTPGRTAVHRHHGYLRNCIGALFLAFDHGKTRF
jgi:hypothetical protein